MSPQIRWRLALLALVSLAVSSLGAQSRLVRSQSGPSGKLVGSDFVLDEVRSRFVYPKDQTVTVYFEWEWPAGDHVLTASWVRPDGRVASVSPDVKILTTSTRLTAYWLFNVVPAVPSGTWTVEVRIDGQPAGSHSFELAGLDGDKFTIDKVVKTYGPSVVRVHALDATGREITAASGCVIGPNKVATAFEAIDSATGLDIEFADGRHVRTTSVLAASRLDDWAIIGADTASLAPIPRGDVSKIPIGGRLATFDFDNGALLAIPVDIGAVSATRGYGPRIFFSPGVAADAAGGPLIDETGSLVGLQGGSFEPGARVLGTQHSEIRRMGINNAVPGTATAISALPPTLPASGGTLADLAAANQMTGRLTSMPEYVSGGMTTVLPKNPMDYPADVWEISAAGDPTVTAYVSLSKRDKRSKGKVSATIFDAQNNKKTTSPDKQVSLTPVAQRVFFTFPPKDFAPGYYRVEISWDGEPFFRAFFKIKP